MNIRSRLSLFRQNFRRSEISFHGESFFSNKTFVLAVGSTFKHSRPDAMMLAREGYCNAFASLNISYKIVDISEIEKVINEVANPFVMVFSADLNFRTRKYVKHLRKVPTAVWVSPDFRNSRKFFDKHCLDFQIWETPVEVKRQIEQIGPNFVFSATLNSGASFFENWIEAGFPFLSLPLALDTKKYNLSISRNWELNSTELAFVGGYWPSKSLQIDPYLRPFENKLAIYGYSKWPYNGYKGPLVAAKEPDLYNSAKICPVINEPSVKLLHGQINERVFKVLGSGGFPITDDVPQYKDLLRGNILISSGPENFYEMVSFFLKNPDKRLEWMERGRKEVFERHTYIHRAEQLMNALKV